MVFALELRVKGFGMQKTKELLLAIVFLIRLVFKF